MMSEPIDLVLARLPGAKRSGRGWRARCPSHPDDHPSLDIAVGNDDRVLLHCWSGCSNADVVAGLGISFRNLYRRRTRPTETRRWTIRNVDGSVAAHLSRIEPGHHGRTKDYIWYQPDGKRRGLNGVPLADLPLFTTPGNGPVVVVEGPKAADAVAAAGFPAAATLTGASTIPGDAALAVLRGRDVVFWPDFDQPGIDHMARVAARTAAITRAAQIVEPDPIWPVGTDAADLPVDQVLALIGRARTLNPMRSQGERHEGVLELIERLLSPTCVSTPTQGLIGDDAPGFVYASPTREEVAPLLRAYEQLQCRPVSAGQAGLLRGIYRVHGPEAVTRMLALHRERGSVRDLLKDLRHLKPEGTKEY